MKRVKITYRAAYAAPDAVEGYLYAMDDSDTLASVTALFITPRQYRRARHNISVGGDCGIRFNLPSPYDTVVLLDNNGYIDTFLQ